MIPCREKRPRRTLSQAKKGYALGRLMIDRFIEADDRWYDSIRQMLVTDRKTQRDTHVSRE
jgi:hypothetical protein